MSEQHIRSISSRSRWRLFGISRQGVHRHIQSLCGNRKSCGYKARRAIDATRCDHWPSLRTSISLKTPLEEDRLWREDIRPVLGDLPANVLTICQHGFTEMMNNAIEHSAGTKVFVSVEKTALVTAMTIHDDGQGIFKKIQRELGLYNEHDAVLELAKGKLTTDPARHSGEGIFFTSRMFDSFVVTSGTVLLSHTEGADEEQMFDDLVFDNDTPGDGTCGHHAHRQHCLSDHQRGL